MIAILDKNDFVDFDLINERYFGNHLLNYIKFLDEFNLQYKNDVLIFQDKSERIILKSAHENYYQAYDNNILTDKWIERFK